MSQIYTIMNTLNELYDNAYESIGETDYKHHYKKLSRYLFKLGLIKKTRNITMAKQFVEDLEHEIPTLTKLQLKIMYTTFVDLLWKLQTGDLIPISELIYISNKKGNKLSLPVVIIELIEESPKIKELKEIKKIK
jgi:hypothetical protein